MEINENPFFSSYQTKSNLELQQIAAAKEDYRLEARYAATQLLKDRGESSDHEESTITEFSKHQSDREKEIDDFIYSTEKIIQQLNQIKKSGRWPLNGWNELRIKRLSDSRFRVRIEGNRLSQVAPLIVCEIRNGSDLLMYPFFYWNSFIYASIFTLGVVVAHFFHLYTFDSWKFTASFPLVFILLFQLAMSPAFFFIVRDKLRKTLG